MLYRTDSAIPVFVEVPIVVDVTFLEELASKAPTPGGGGASAYCGALAAALSQMVGSLTVGKKKYADVEADVAAHMEKLEGARASLVRLIDEDAAAFTPLAAAYSMPKTTPEEQAAKDAALQGALVGACEVPLEIMRQCVAVIDSCEFMAYHGSRLAVSDAGVSAVFAKAALQGASLNVLINIGSMADAGRATAYREELDLLLTRGCQKADEVYAYVVEHL